MDKILIEFDLFRLLDTGRVMPDFGFLHIGLNAGYA